MRKIVMRKMGKRNMKKRKNWFEKIGSCLGQLAQFVSENQNKVMLVFMFLVMIGMVSIVQYRMNHMETRETMVRKSLDSSKDKMGKSTAVPVQSASPKPTENPEKKIYTYLQGPKSWGERRTWSGEWGEQFMDGGSFGGFGCGLCCVANVYSSLTKYQCTPTEAYRFAKKKTGYMGGGAIEWGYMRRSLTAMGMDCRVQKKPESYETFQHDIAEGKCCIVLVSSNNSTCYWKETPGHYVTLFLYDEKKDTVFLADSGEPSRNRQRISLKKVYKSLKTASGWQYLTIKAYTEKNDTWKHRKAKGNWVRP